MKTRITALTTILTLTLTGVALAGTNVLTGKGRGDGNSSVTVKIRTSKSGKPTHVLSVAFKRFDYQCDGDAGTFTGEKSGTLSKRGGFKLKKGTSSGKTYYYLTASAKSGGLEYDLSAQISANGRKIVSGSARATGFAGPQRTSCQLTGGYTAKVK